MPSRKIELLSILIVICLLFSGFIGMLYIMSDNASAATISTSGTKPTTGEIITGSYEFIVNDAGSATRCELRIDGVLISYMDPTSGDPEWDYTINTSGWPDGAHLIRYDSIGGTGGNDVITIPVKFDNNGPAITNRTAVYDVGLTAVSSGSTVRVRATIADSISGVHNVTCNATSIGGPQWVEMHDDGLNQDGNALDGIYGSEPIMVDVSPGYRSVFIWARDNKGNFNNQTVGVNVDNYEPTIMGIQPVLPAGQTGIKNGDEIRIVASAFDFKLEIIEVVVRQPLDVVLVLDNSGSMLGQKWSKLEAAATAFVDTLANGDRCAIYSFNLQSDQEGVKRYQNFLQMDKVYTCQDCNLVTDIGRNLTKHVITEDDGVHLTRSNGNPNCWTPIWDTIGEAVIYAQNNHLTDHVPVIVAMTDGNDAGWPSNEIGSETFCPGAPNGAMNQTWTITGGCYWGSPTRSYSAVLREFDTNLFNSYTTVSFSGSTSRDGTRTGLINCSIPIFTIGLGNSPQGSNSSASGYINPTTNNYKYTTEFDLHEIGNSSLGGKYYYAPSGNELNEIYQKISQEIEKFGINTLGKTAPHGIKKLEADLSSVGISQKVTMFDDGNHGDASPNDDIYGSALIYVNSMDTGNIVFSVEGTDIAGNSNSTISSIYLDNIQPSITNITPHYPPARSKAQDGYSIYFSAITNDYESGLGAVYLDASSIGGGTDIPMNDGGEGNDEYAFDGVYTSINFTVATGLQSSTFTVKIKSYDKARNLAEHSGNIEINNEVDIIMNNLVTGEVINGNFPISVNISDPDGIPISSTNPKYRIDTNPWYNLTLQSGTNYGATINTNTYLDGAHTIYVNAKDTYGAESTLETDIKIDNTPPSEVTIVTPIIGQYVKGVDSFKCTAVDAIGLNNVTITITNNTGAEKVANASMGYNSDSGYYQFVFASSSFADGTYNVTTYAHDHAGHETASSQTQFYIDNNDPSITLNYPQNANYVYGYVKFNITVDEVFLDKIEYNVDDSGWVNHTTVWNTTKINDGSYTIQIRAIDLAGNEDSVYIVVKVDNNFPVCILSQPAQFKFINGIYVLKSYSFDEVGLSSVKLEVFRVVEINATNKSITEVLNTTMAYNAGTGYYEHIFDTTNLPDGNYTINVSSEDLAGNITFTGNITFYIDNNAPELMITDPYKGKIVSGNVEFNITIINESFLDWVRYNIDGTGWIDLTVPWNTLAVQDGAHTIDIRAHDLAGHNTDQSISVIVDNNNPVCNIIAPIANQYIEGIYTFKIDANDLVKIDRVTISIFGETINTTYNTATSIYEYSLDTSVYGDGIRYVSAMAYDTSGKTLNAIPVPFFVDNYAPGMILNSPIDGQFVKGEFSINVTILELYPDTMEYNIDSKGWTSLAVPWDTNPLMDGEHTLDVRVTDKLGHSTMQTINVIVDNHDPICIIQAPIENQYVSGTFTFNILALDEVGVDLVELLVFYNTINVVHNTQTGYYEFTINTKFLEDGDYNVTAVCRDNANRTVFSMPVDFKIDNKVPILQVRSPLNGVYVTGNVVIDIDINDAFPCITEYNIDGNGWIPYQINPVWNSKTVGDGEHVMEIRSTDPIGHVAEQKITILVDNFAPDCSIHSPASGQNIEGTFTFKVLAQDELGIRYVALTMFGGTVNATYNSQSNYYEYTIALATLLDGVYNISVKAYDNSGKLTKVGSIGFNVDNNAPILTINSPVSNAFVSGTIRIDLTVDDAFPTTTSYNVDGSGWVVTAKPWETGKERDGEHTLAIRAKDDAGHIIEQTITLNVDNTPPKISIVLPKENDYISGIYIVKVYATDTFGIESVLLSIDGGQPMEIAQNPSTGLYEMPIDTTKLMLDDGEYIIKLEAFDNVFKSSNTSVIIFIDNSPPELKLDYPKEGKGEIQFKVNASDLSGIDKVQINIDGTGWRDLTTIEGENDTFKFIWRTSNSDNGYHIFDIKIIDELGNEVIIPGSFSVDNKKEEDQLGFLLEVLPLIAFIVIMIIIMIVFILLKRGTFHAWAGKVGSTIRHQYDEPEDDYDYDHDQNLDEDLDDDDELDFEFARGDADAEGAGDYDYNDDDYNDFDGHDDSGPDPEREGEDEDVDEDENISWFEQKTSLGSKPRTRTKRGHTKKMKLKTRKRRLKKVKGV